MQSFGFLVLVFSKENTILRTLMRYLYANFIHYKIKTELTERLIDKKDAFDAAKKA